MAPNYFALAIPFFFLFIFVEMAVSYALGRRLYRYGDALSDLSAGTVSELSKIFVHTLLFAGYLWVYAHRVHDFSASDPATWALSIIGVDFVYYWWHRFSHEVNALWAGHVVHHTSEDFNLAVALRQAVFTHFTGIPFYLPLALVGVPPVVHLTVQSFNVLYQFWIHTELIGKLGPVEWVMNTPSHHRVHHAINPRYLDRNYAGVFIVWDRLFGTFAREEEECVYGTTRPLGSFDPVWTQVHYWFEMAREAARAPALADRFRVWVASPAWHPRGLGEERPSMEGVTRARRPKYDPTIPRGVVAYTLVQFALALGLATVLLFGQEKLPMPVLVVGSALVVATMWTCSALCERRPFARGVEAARLVAVAAAGLAFVAWR